jgi:two-component system NtrC family sensor kinase
VVLSIHQRFFVGFVAALAGGALVGALAFAGPGEGGIAAAAGILGVLLAAGIVAAHRLARRISAPLRQLEEAMHRVAEGDFGVAAPGPTHDAEIASLAASFTQMRDRLKDTMISLELAVENLHDKQEQLVEVEKLASLGRVAAGVAHEINNPLAVINEKAGLLQDFLAISGEFRNRERFGPLLEGIADSVKRCRAITHRLLGFARRTEVTVEPVDLNAEVRRVCEYLEGDRAEKAVRLEPILAEGLPLAHTDRIEFEQVLVNIVKNAIDAVPRGGRIGITTRAKNQRWLQVVVADNGPGIPPEQLKRLFEPFFTTKEKGKGTGLGLFVSRGIMKKLGGRILVESAVGIGTNFTLELPVRHVAQELSGE